MLLEEVLNKVRRNQQIFIEGKKGNWIFMGEVSEWEITKLRTIPFELLEIYLDKHAGDVVRDKVILRVEGPMAEFSVKDLAEMVTPNTMVYLRDDVDPGITSIKAPSKVILKEEVLEKVRNMMVREIYYTKRDGLVLTIKREKGKKSNG